MKIKVCSKCKIEKDIESYCNDKFKKDGKRTKCKECDKKYRENNKNKIKEYYNNHKKERLNYNKKYWQKTKIIQSIQDKEKDKQRIKEWYEENKEKIKEKTKIYRDKNKERIKDYNKEYNKKHRTQQTENVNKKRKNDSLYKFKCNIRDLLRKSLKRQGYKKSTRSFDILCESFDNVWSFLLNNAKLRYTYFKEEDFLENNKYHIDHIIPLVTAKTEEDVIRLCHYTNLQLLTKEENLAKHDKTDWK